MNSLYTFGAYLYEDSIVHELDARVKIVLACAFSFSIALVDDWWALLAFACALLVLFALGKIPLTRAAKGLAPLLFILVFTLLVHMFVLVVPADEFGNPEEGYMRLIGSFGVSVSGTLQGLFLSLRIALLMLCGSLLTFTTSMDELSWAISSLMAPLFRVRVPVAEIAMIIALALRLVPVLIDKAYSIRRAQISRGARFESGSIFDRIRSWNGVLIPLIIGLIRYSDELSDVLDMRGFSGVAPLSLGTRHQTRRIDVPVLVVVLALIITITLVSVLV